MGFSVGDDVFQPDAMNRHEAVAALAAAEKAGIDLSLLDSNLALSHEERVLRHESALELMQAMRAAGIVHEKSVPAAAKAH